MTAYENAQASYNRAIARADFECAVRCLDEALSETADPWVIETIRRLRSEASAHIRRPFSLASLWRRAQ